MPQISAENVPAEDIEWLRMRFRLEANSQIVHDSLHRRSGWTKTYQLKVADEVAGFASIAIAGPWVDRPTIYEFYLLPNYRTRAFQLFEQFLTASQARFFEVQSNQSLLTSMLFRYAENIRSEAMVFCDQSITQLQVERARIVWESSTATIQTAISERKNGGKWSLIVDDMVVGSGGILFHYNYPYSDIYMEVIESKRGQGYGAYLVQELKRICYQLGAIPCARCNPTNLASQRTLQRAGFVPYAHILDGDLKL